MLAEQKRFDDPAPAFCFENARSRGSPTVNQTSQPPTTPASPEQLQWFAQEVHTHESVLKAYIRGAFPGVGDVDDIVQESYLRLWRIRAAEPIRSAKALLFTVARRVALDLIRRRRRSPFVPVKDVSQLFVYDTSPGPGEAAAADQERQLMVEAVESLPARCRAIFTLCHLDGLTQREVAERFGLSENTVAVQSARGLQRCEAHLRRRLKR
jgi:RNA polymerase sigma factor (sigma-70 family)